MDANDLDELIKELNERPQQPNWRMAYIENIKNGVIATNLLPTFAGFHRNLGLRDDGNFHAGFTLIYGDNLFYGMVMSIRSKGQ